jgi:CubicO group peptidase (beta-lactamase class C family)
MIKRIWILLYLLFIISAAHAQTRGDTVKDIEQIFNRYKAKKPGCQLAVSRNGKVIFSRAWGMADLEHQAPLSTSSVIEAGSVSKQFTAAAILLLEQQGKLSLDDDIHKYIPELPDYGTPVTLRQMMHHTSGLKDWGSLMALSDWPRGTRIYSNADVLSIMSRQHTLNHKPGDEFLYSNSNYVLFAIITERVSGQSLADYTRIHIFEPAGMNHTSWRTDIKKIVPNRAIAYGKNEGAYFTDMPNENVYGNGGLLTTAEDLLRWNTYYQSGKLGAPSLLPAQLATVPLNNGSSNNYAAGLRVNSYNGQQIITHDGATAAYRALLEYYSSSGISVAWLANTAEFDGAPDGTSELRDLLLKKEAFEPNEKNTRFAKAGNTSGAVAEEKLFVLTGQALQEYTGEYYSEEVDSKLAISLIDGKLIITRYSKARFALTPTHKDAFDIANSKVRVDFERDQSKQVRFLKFTTIKVKNVSFKKM